MMISAMYGKQEQMMISDMLYSKQEAMQIEGSHSSFSLEQRQLLENLSETLDQWRRKHVYACH